jgi:ABC-type microcin C transport system permease subunit YejE
MRLSRDLQTKIQKFKRDKRAYYSFLFLLAAFAATLPAELLCNVRPILLVVDGKPYFPVFVQYGEKDFGGTLPSEPDYKSAAFIRLLSGNGSERSGDSDFVPPRNAPSAFELTLDDFDEDKKIPDNPGESFSLSLNDFDEGDAACAEGDAPATPCAPGMTRESANVDTNAAAQKPREYWMLWPPIRYDYQYIPSTSKTGKVALAAPYRVTDQPGGEATESSWLDGHYLGTDDRGRDVLARLIYGFRISLVFGISLAITGTLLGCLIGGFQGFFGGWIDLIGQRLTEIWGSFPRLYILIILSSFLVPSALLLFLILNLTAWMGIAAYIRAEFLKSRNLEYVKAAKAMGVADFEIMLRHILPNSLTPVVTFFPFEVTSGILALVSLDYLNLGVPSPAPSIGELLAQGKNNLQATWIILPTFALLTATLTLLTFVGEGIRNAFDPRRA